MKEELVKKAYDIALERYAAVGVDANEAIEKLQKISLSLHCWQADDVTGFENPDGQLSGGIQATGNHPGKARNIEELRQDILKAASYIPGTHRLNLQQHMAISEESLLIATKLNRSISKVGWSGLRRME